MCSGCSGYFEGDGGDEGSDDDRVPELESSRAGGFSMERHELWEERNDLARSVGGDKDDYEVLVSADFIVERRTIRANCCAVSPEGAPERLGSRRRDFGDEHSLLASANFYRTCGQFESKRPTEGGTDGRCLMLWGLAGAAVFGLAMWLTVG
jgi:hypothetical protein